MLSSFDTFFWHTDSKQFQPIYDLLFPPDPFKIIPSEAFKARAEILYERLKKQPDFYEEYWGSEPNPPATFQECLDQGKRRFFIIDRLMVEQANMLDEEGGIAYLIGPDIYNQITTLASNEAVKEWSNARRNPLMEAITRMPLNCTNREYHGSA